MGTYKLCNNLERSRKITLCVFGFLGLSVAIIGLLNISLSKAATATASTEPENGAFSGSAAVIATTDASGGRAIQFKAGTSSDITPYVLARSGSSSAQLTIKSGQRLRLAGTAIWALPGPDYSTTPGNLTNGTGIINFANGQYANIATSTRTIKSWGGNIIRLRLDAHAYEAGLGGLSKAQVISRVRSIRDTAVAQHMYLMPCWWDSHEPQEYGADYLPSHYTESFAMMRDIYAALGNDPHVMYEPWNEPDIGAPSSQVWGSWQTVMKGTLDQWRSVIGYRGVLSLDTLQGSSAWDEASVAQIEAYDAKLLSGSPQIMIVKHDYAVGQSSFSGTNWDNRYPDNGTHVILESEFGYHVNGFGDQAAYSNQATTFFATHFTARAGYAGAVSFLWGPWYDSNAVTGTDNVTPVAPWGNDVKNNFLGKAGATQL